MLTHCFIGQQLPDGKIRGVYCNSGGNLLIVGDMLARYYGDPNVVSQLLDLGNLSILGPGPNNGTSALHRDLGQEFVPPHLYHSLDAITFLHHGILFVQLQGGTWLFNNEEDWLDLPPPILFSEV
jgi:hypothetical protein